MARQPVPGERPLYWVGSSKGDLTTFPEEVVADIGNALGVAQFGGTHSSAKPCTGRKTPLADVRLVEKRLKSAREQYEADYGKDDK